MIEEMVTTLQPAIAKNANTIRVRIWRTRSGMMRADITKVRQILFNLLSNACKFTDHGTISLDVDPKHGRGPRLDSIPGAATPGIGISAKQQKNLFQEFAQADASIARKYGGTGLGLAISYRFVQLMKGRISVESEPGQGSTFTVHLPAQVTLETAESSRSEGSSECIRGIAEHQNRPGYDSRD